MSSMHPHWNETSQEEQTVPVHAVNKQSSNKSYPASGIPISRKPAAILGMLIVSSLAFTYYYGFSRITGQVSDSPPVIYITEDGVDPESVTVHQGQTITWINKQMIPHIIESLDLCNSSEDCLYTPTVFPGEQINFKISYDIAPGTYTYSSVTSETVNGEIIVVEGAAALPSPETQEPQEPVDEPINEPPDTLLPSAPLLPETNNSPAINEEIDIFSNTQDTFIPSPTPIPALPAASSAPLETNNSFDTDKNNNTANTFTPSSPPPPPPPTPTPKVNIPTNPNVNRNLPFDANITGRSNRNASPPTINSVYKPFKQPETGASSWIVFILSIAGLMWVTRHTFAKT